ncbi:hypothetical protein BD770DRAFT_402547 [Pilaira anomala]|nr:hypothetical protein BD770DRAFT_402547 [Pilaira anomala]
MTRENSSWDTVPNEILELIVNHCGRNCKKVKWMFVNKKWFNYYLSQGYHSIKIDLSNNRQDIKLNQIMLLSGLNVGRWVKKITFGGFSKVNDFTNYYIPGDKLSLLMKSTPNVEEVYFSKSQTFDITAWTYFSVILLENDDWKLRVLPKPIDGVLCSSVYYVCALHSRHTLKSLYLTPGMLSKSSYECLKEFTALETLHLEKGFLNSFNQLDMMLRNLTNIKEIVIDFGSNRFMLFPPKLEKQPYLYPNIKELTLNNFTPKGNDELLVFSENFIGLEKLDIVGEKDILWPAAEVDSVVTEIFFDTIVLLSEYQIKVEGNIAMASFMENWNNSVRGSTREIFLSIEYDSTNNLHPSLTINEKKSRSTTALYYVIHNVLEEMNTLNTVSNTVSKIQLSGIRDGNNSLFPCLKAIFQQIPPNLKTVTIANSRLFTHSQLIFFEPSLSFERLEFHNCSMDLTIFENFLHQFKSLDYLEFIDCSLSRGYYDNSQSLRMGNTAIGTMCISNCKVSNDHHYSYNNYHTGAQNPPAVVSISVYLADRDITKYYVMIDDHVIDVIKDTFNTLISSIQSYVMTIITIEVKSIKKLLLKPNHSSSGFIEIPIRKL